MRTDISSTRTSGTPAVSPSPLPWIIVALVGVAAALTAQFMLDSWADQYEAAHWVQHGLLFVAGGMIGGCLLRLYQLGHRAA